MCLSLKGEKSLETLKHLRNYMIALIIHDPPKLIPLLDFL
jgi:predicted methyltransferase